MKTNLHRLIISVQLLWLFWDVSCTPCLYLSLGYINVIGVFISCCFTYYYNYFPSVTPAFKHVYC